MTNPSKNNTNGDDGKKDPRPEIKLPFEKKEREPGVWVYENRMAIIVTVIIYLIVAIVFVSAKVVVQYREQRNEIVFDLEDLERLQKELERLEQLNRDLQRSNEAAYDNYGDVRNIVSNENARVAELEDNDRQVQEMIRGNRDLLDQAAEELRLMEEQARMRDEQTTEREDVKAQGRVTVSFSLRNPTRTAVHLFVPAYRCEAGGRVVVNITVNTNGDVIAASVNKSSSSDDYCMTTTALDAAQRSRFNVYPGAPARQTGTITYTFIPQ